MVSSIVFTMIRMEKFYVRKIEIWVIRSLVLQDHLLIKIMVMLGTTEMEHKHLLMIHLKR